MDIHRADIATAYATCDHIGQLLSHAADGETVAIFRLPNIILRDKIAYMVNIFSDQVAVFDYVVVQSSHSSVEIAFLRYCLGKVMLSMAATLITRKG